MSAEFPDLKFIGDYFLPERVRFLGRKFFFSKCMGVLSHAFLNTVQYALHQHLGFLKGNGGVFIADILWCMFCYDGNKHDRGAEDKRTLSQHPGKGREGKGESAEGRGGLAWQPPPGLWENIPQTAAARNAGAERCCDS